ncbi:hypothetical protein EWM64_g163 [Hericium alpestre]|uniref:non-specific serine/threonine protein kinase n=1 Tax=Hericium alpestre TaxID=135208 RepID=A0A4Z0A9Q3_9AGAM|nr:hypothetical protein EWM64_g163 [Hericium alpestre]
MLIATNAALVASNSALHASNSALHASNLALRACDPDAGVQTVIPALSRTPSAGIPAPTIFHTGQPRVQVQSSRIRDLNLHLNQNAAVEAWQAGVPRVESPPVSYEPEPIVLHDGRVTYIKTGFLGEGGFGEVLLARAVPNSENQDLSFPTDVAIKRFPKRRLRHVKYTFEAACLEMDLMKQATEKQLRFVVHLLSTFQDEENVYLVMPAYGRDLFHYLRRGERRMPMNEIRLYAAQMILALEEIHSLGVVHRDIKPENVFFDRHGYLVFGDFSIAGYPDGETFEQGKLYDFSGTPCRYAPEQLGPDREVKGYNYKIDIFNVGSMILEMFIGKGDSYFQESKRDEGEKEILNKDIWPDCQIFVENKAARDLITGMLERDPEKRLTIPEIKAHRFFRKM